MGKTTKERPDRTFTKMEMFDFAKKKLSKANPGIVFGKMTYNILPVEWEGKPYNIYIGTSRDFESLREGEHFNSFRVSAWHKGTRKKFSTYDYYVLLVKVAENSSYITETHERIEGLLVSLKEMETWLNNKVSVPSEMRNFYVHYSQVPGGGRQLINVVDNREAPVLKLDHLFQKGWALR